MSLQSVRQLRLRQHEWGDGDGPCAGEPLHGSFGGRRAGNYTVTAQLAVTHSDVRFRVDDWSLTVEKARVS